MNQILVTEKLYITPELKRKKKLYKLELFLSVLLICLLSSYYIYAEYDRNKSEEVSQAILSQSKTDDTTKSSTNDPIIIVLSEAEANEAEETAVENVTVSTTNNTAIIDGKIYYTEAYITIPKIGITYPVLSETSDELLEISVNKYWGPNPNEVGNYCIVGHNYKNGKMFGRLSELQDGDIVEIEDTSGNVVEYEVYRKYIVDPTDTSCTSQLTNGRKELTLITCTSSGSERLIVKCREK